MSTTNAQTPESIVRLSTRGLYTMLHQRVIRGQFRWLHVALHWHWEGHGQQVHYPLRELLLERLPEQWPLAQAIGSLVDIRNETSWRHRRGGQFSDWSLMFGAVFGQGWCDFALNSSAREWRSHTLRRSIL